MMCVFVCLVLLNSCSALLWPVAINVVGLLFLLLWHWLGVRVSVVRTIVL